MENEYLQETAPDISVIVPVYNVEPYLRLCLDSVLNQNFAGEIEVIIVDDGSPDGSPAICDEYKARDPRVRVIHKRNQGLGPARNSGIEIARGEWLCFLDSDDYLAPDTLSRLHSLATENNLDIVRCGHNVFTEPGRFSCERSGGELKIYEGRDILRQIALCYFSQPHGKRDEELDLEGSAWGALYRRELFFPHGIRFVSERELVSEDYIFNYECTQRINRIGKITDTLVHYRFNPNSLTKVPRRDCLDRSITYSEYLERQFRQDGYGEEEAAVYAMGYTVKMMRAHVKNLLLSPIHLAEKRQWLRSQARLPYLKRIGREYPRKEMRFKHRAILSAILGSHTLMAYLLVCGREGLRSLTGK